MEFFLRQVLPQPPATDLFPDGGFVRMRNRANGKYLTADEDWVGVSLQDLPRGADPSHSRLTQVWRVERRATHDGVFFRLQGAAYGRYLALPRAPEPGLFGLKAVQRGLDEGDAMAFSWSADRVDASRRGHDDDYVRIGHITNCDLRATRRYGPWNTGVTVELKRLRCWITTKLHWTVEVVGATLEPLPLPPLPVIPPQSPIQEGLRSLLFWRRRVDPVLTRTIRHVRANPDGDFQENEDLWPPTFSFHGRSVFNLRYELAHRQDDWNGDVSFITLCVRPGLDGGLLPLVTDLPRSEEGMDIIVLTTGSPAAAALVYPHLDPLEQ